MDRSQKCHVADVLIIDFHLQTALIRLRLELRLKLGKVCDRGGRLYVPSEGKLEVQCTQSAAVKLAYNKYMRAPLLQRLMSVANCAASYTPTEAISN